MAIVLSPRHAAASFANLACGAYLLHRWNEAEQFASRSVELGTSRAQAEAVKVARPVLQRARARLVPDAAEKPPPRCTTRALELSAATISRLATWRGPTWKRKQQSGLEDVGPV